MMENVFASPIFIGGVAFVLSIILTYAVRGFARKHNFVARPQNNRWHKKPTALMGGVAIFLATILVYLVFVPKATASWVIIGGSTLLFVVGMIDDIRTIKPYQKIDRTVDRCGLCDRSAYGIWRTAIGA